MDRREFLKATAGGLATLVLSSRESVGQDIDQEKELNSIRNDLEYHLGREINDLAVEPISIGSGKPAYLCSLGFDVSSSGSSMTGLHTDKGIYFFRNGLEKSLRFMEELLYEDDPDNLVTQRLIRREYQERQVPGDFVSYNMDPTNEDALIWLDAVHEKQHEKDTKQDDLPLRQAAQYIRKHHEKERQEYTGVPWVNLYELAEERAMLAELLFKGYEYYTMSHIISATRLDDDARFERQAAQIIIQYFDNRMQAAGIKEGQYHCIKRKDIKAWAFDFAERYHPDMLEH